MTIWINGAEREITATQLEQVLVELGYGSAKVATALNGDFVPKAERGTTEIRNGDRLEIVAPLQGG